MTDAFVWKGESDEGSSHPSKITNPCDDDLASTPREASVRLTSPKVDDPDEIEISDDPPSGWDGYHDAKLVEASRRGIEPAFAALVLRYERKLIRVLYRLVNDRELARDLAQETFWKVYTRLDRFDTARRFGPWLFRVGVNLALDRLRRHSGPPVTSFDTHDGRGGSLLEPSQADPRTRDELAQEVHFVLNLLPLPYKTILVLRDLEGLSSAEVAAIVDRREATIRWRLAKAREMFRQHWLRRGSESSPKDQPRSSPAQPSTRPFEGEPASAHLPRHEGDRDVH